MGLKCRKRKKCLGDRIQCGVNWVTGNIWKCFQRQGRVWFCAVLPCVHAHIHTHFPRKMGLLPSIIKNVFSVELAAYERKI